MTNVGFGKAIEHLKNGGYVGRASWNGSRVLMMQVPATIQKEIIPKMASLPQSVKDIMKTLNVDGISYHDQVIGLEFNGSDPVKATYYALSWEDVFSEDWQLYDIK